jgi:hypothetical protein
MGAYHAKDAMVYMGVGANEATELKGCSEWTLDMATDTVEVTSFGDTNKQYVQGLPDVSGSLSGFVRDDEQKWFDAQSATAPIKLYLYFTRQTTGRYAKGLAWFSLSLNNTVSSANEISGNFVAAGPWVVDASN